MTIAAIICVLALAAQVAVHLAARSESKRMYREHVATCEAIRADARDALHVAQVIRQHALPLCDPMERPIERGDIVLVVPAPGAPVGFIREGDSAVGVVRVIHKSAVHLETNRGAFITSPAPLVRLVPVRDLNRRVLNVAPPPTRSLN